MGPGRTNVDRYENLKNPVGIWIGETLIQEGDTWGVGRFEVKKIGLNAKTMLWMVQGPGSELLSAVPAEHVTRLDYV